MSSKINDICLLEPLVEEQNATIVEVEAHAAAAVDCPVEPFGTVGAAVMNARHDQQVAFAGGGHETLDVGATLHAPVGEEHAADVGAAGRHGGRVGAVATVLDASYIIR